jgi:hypothetical protein
MEETIKIGVILDVTPWSVVITKDTEEHAVSIFRVRQ